MNLFDLFYKIESQKKEYFSHIVRTSGDEYVQCEVKISIKGERRSFYIELFPELFTEDGSVFPVICSNLPGVVSQGISKYNALQSILKAIILSLNVRLLTGYSLEGKFEIINIPLDIYLNSPSYISTNEIIDYFKGRFFSEFKRDLDHIVMINDDYPELTLVFPDSELNKSSYFQLENTLDY